MMALIHNKPKKGTDAKFYFTLTGPFHKSI